MNVKVWYYVPHKQHLSDQTIHLSVTIIRSFLPCTLNLILLARNHQTVVRGFTIADIEIKKYVKNIEGYSLVGNSPTDLISYIRVI